MKMYSDFQIRESDEAKFAPRVWLNPYSSSFTDFALPNKIPLTRSKWVKGTSSVPPPRLERGFLPPEGNALSAEL